MTETKKTKLQTMDGTVLSSRMGTTIVAVYRLVKHPKYGKFIQYRKKYKAHDSAPKREVGEKVSIVPCAPISKDKRFKVIN